MENLIINDLKHGGALFRVRGILRCVTKNSVSDAEKNAIHDMVSDRVLVAGKTVGAYARAALRILGFAELKPDDDEAVEAMQILLSESDRKHD